MIATALVNIADDALATPVFSSSRASLQPLVHFLSPSTPATYPSASASPAQRPPGSRSYLSNGKQRVTVRDSSSTLAPVDQGVPQGSVLRPLLFTIYMLSASAAMPMTRGTKPSTRLPQQSPCRLPAPNRNLDVI